MVDVVNNNNSHMKLPKLNVGVVEAPKKNVKVELYNEAEAKMKLKKMRQEIRRAERNNTFEKNQQMPAAVFVLIGAGLAAFGLYKLNAHTAVKNLFNRLKRI